jgi:bacterioferritin (cytochrome b1)
MDTCLHHVQGKAKRVTDLLPLLQEFYRDKLSAVLQHTADARVVSDYDANNTYQYIINREETELSWVAQAIVELGGEVPTADGSDGERQAADMRAVMERNVRDAQAFVDRWRPRVEAMSNARHRKMLNVILGEALEQKRFFEQALAGRHDLLGRRTEDVGPLVGKVLPTRWVE